MDKNELYQALRDSTDLLTSVLCGRDTLNMGDQIAQNLELLENPEEDAFYLATFLEKGKYNNVWLRGVHPTEYLLWHVEHLNKIGYDSPIPDFPVLVSYNVVDRKQFDKAVETHINAPSLYSGVEIFTRANFDEPYYYEDEAETND